MFNNMQAVMSMRLLIFGSSLRLIMPSPTKKKKSENVVLAERANYNKVLIQFAVVVNSL